MKLGFDLNMLGNILALINPGASKAGAAGTGVTGATGEQGFAALLQGAESDAGGAGVMTLTPSEDGGAMPVTADLSAPVAVAVDAPDQAVATPAIDHILARPTPAVALTAAPGDAYRVKNDIEAGQVERTGEVRDIPVEQGEAAPTPQSAAVDVDHGEDNKLPVAVDAEQVVAHTQSVAATAPVYNHIGLKDYLAETPLIRSDDRARRPDVPVGHDDAPVALPIPASEAVMGDAQASLPAVHSAPLPLVDFDMAEGQVRPRADAPLAHDDVAPVAQPRTPAMSIATAAPATPRVVASATDVAVPAAPDHAPVIATVTPSPVESVAVPVAQPRAPVAPTLPHAAASADDVAVQAAPEQASFIATVTPSPVEGDSVSLAQPHAPTAPIATAAPTLPQAAPSAADIAVQDAPEHASVIATVTPSTVESVAMPVAQPRAPMAPIATVAPPPHVVASAADIAVPASPAQVPIVETAMLSPVEGVAMPVAQPRAPIATAAPTPLPAGASAADRAVPVGPGRAPVIEIVRDESVSPATMGQPAVPHAAPAIRETVVPAAPLDAPQAGIAGPSEDAVVLVALAGAEAPFVAHAAAHPRSALPGEPVDDAPDDKGDADVSDEAIMAALDAVAPRVAAPVSPIAMPVDLPVQQATVAIPAQATTRHSASAIDGRSAAPQPVMQPPRAAPAAPVVTQDAPMPTVPAQRAPTQSTSIPVPPARAAAAQAEPISSDAMPHDPMPREVAFVAAPTRDAADVSPPARDPMIAPVATQAAPVPIDVERKSTPSQPVAVDRADDAPPVARPRGREVPAAAASPPVAVDSVAAQSQIAPIAAPDMPRAVAPTVAEMSAVSAAPSPSITPSIGAVASPDAAAPTSQPAQAEAQSVPLAIPVQADAESSVAVPVPTGSAIQAELASAPVQATPVAVPRAISATVAAHADPERVAVAAPQSVPAQGGATPQAAPQSEDAAMVAPAPVQAGQRAVAPPPAPVIEAAPEAATSQVGADVAEPLASAAPTPVMPQVLVAPQASAAKAEPIFATAAAPAPAPVAVRAPRARVTASLAESPVQPVTTDSAAPAVAATAVPRADSPAASVPVPASRQNAPVVPVQATAKTEPTIKKAPVAPLRAATASDAAPIVRTSAPAPVAASVPAAAPLLPVDAPAAAGEATALLGMLSGATGKDVAPATDAPPIGATIIPLRTANRAGAEGVAVPAARRATAAIPTERVVADPLSVVQPQAAVATVTGAVPGVSANAASVAVPANLAASIDSQVIDMSSGGQWIDGLAREIAALSAGTGQGSFRLSPEHLGPMRVDIKPGTEGSVVTMTVETKAAETALVKDKGALQADARLAGVGIADIKVERVASMAEPARSDNSPNQGSGQGSQQQQTAAQSQSQSQPQQQQTALAQGNDGQGAGNSQQGRKVVNDDAVTKGAETGDPRAGGTADEPRRARYA